MILSASRRTDIPAYYSDWFLNRLKEGYVLARNPMNSSQISRIRLSPEVIDCIVFWTKDPLPMIDKLPLFEEMGYRHYFQFTLTPYGKEVERNLRDKEDLLDTFRQLSDRIGSEKVLWRYDPIILNDSFDAMYHIEHFETLCSKLKGYTKRCTISFVDLYHKIKSDIIRDISEQDMQQLAGIMSEIGSKYGLELMSCCEKLDLSRYGIHPASCIDKATVEQVCGYSIDAKADTNQRTGCGCIQSIDIGVYNTCRNGCIYCYANYSEASVMKNFLSHNPQSELLTGNVREDERIKDREMRSLRNDQLKL
jgi:hypothetical protein